MRRWLLVVLSVALAVSVFAPVAAARGDDDRGFDDRGVHAQGADDSGFPPAWVLGPLAMILGGGLMALGIVRRR